MHCEEAKVIHLTNGYVAIVSASDYEWLVKYSWNIHFSGGCGRNPGKPYARTNIGGRKVYMHRLIIFPDDPSQHVDHFNHQTLDNRRENLRAMDAVDNIKKRLFIPVKNNEIALTALMF